jgi:hypothetical protein
VAYHGSSHFGSSRAFASVSHSSGHASRSSHSASASVRR